MEFQQSLDMIRVNHGKVDHALQVLRDLSPEERRVFLKRMPEDD